ncbi:MAG: HEAT repeat domain-containing protein [Anaerolineales bacterium]|nr:MAG: HEAT repeat domain-containing protein [Anaerolineales bacterium]
MMKRGAVLLLILMVLAGGILACGKESTSSPTPTPTMGTTPTPLPLQASGWGGVTVQTICLEVEQSFPEMPPELKDVATPKISETTQRILGELGLQFVDDSCDATMVITMTGQAIAEEYQGIGRCYEGAQVNGEILLTASGRTPLTLSISSSHPPPSMVSYEQCNKELFEAPFSLVWPQALLDGLTQLWGPQVPIAAMWDEEWIVSTAALSLLGSIEPVEGIAPALIQILESDEWYMVRANAARALGGMGAEEGVIPALIQVLEDEHEDDSVRGVAAVALMQIGPEAAEAVPVLIQVLTDENDFWLSPLAAQALAQIGPETTEVFSALVRALEEGNSSIRETAAEALGQIGPEVMESVPALIQVLGDEYAFVREAAAEALTAITSQDFGEDAGAWQEWWEEQQ